MNAGITKPASELAHRLGVRLSQVLSGWAMIEASQESRAAMCDDVITQLACLEGCDLCDLLLEQLPPTTPEERTMSTRTIVTTGIGTGRQMEFETLDPARFGASGDVIVIRRSMLAGEEKVIQVWIDRNEALELRSFLSSLDLELR